MDLYEWQQRNESYPISQDLLIEGLYILYHHDGFIDYKRAMCSNDAALSTANRD